MTLVDYPNGPWKKLFSGQYDDFSLSIYLNDDGFVLSEILNGDKSKAVLSISKIIGVFGDSETFVETIPRNAIFILDHTNKSNAKFIFLQSDQDVLNYVQQDITNFVNDQFKKLKKDANGIMDIAKSYEINLKDYSELPNELKNSVFSNPLNLFSFITQNRQPKSFSNAQNMIQQTSNQDLFLGNYKTTSEKATEPIDLFSKTFIFGQADNCTRVLIEDLCQNKMNIIIFTSNNNIQNIKYPNETNNQDNKITPMGFPMITYNFGEKLFVNLQDLPNNSFQELIGIKGEISDIIGTVIKEKQSLTLDNLIKDINDYQNPNYTSYTINLASRIVNLAKQQYPGIFLGDFSVSDFYKDSGRNLGTINWVSLSKDNKLASRTIVYNVLKKIISLKNKENKVVLVFDDLPDLFSRKDNDIIANEFMKLLLEDNTNYYIFTAKNEIDIDSKILDLFTAKLSVLEDNEIGITLKTAKPFRFVLRPTYSKV